MAIMTLEKVNVWLESDGQTDMAALLIARAVARVLPFVIGIHPPTTVSKTTSVAVSEAFKNCSVPLGILAIRNHSDGRALIDAVLASKKPNLVDVISNTVASEYVQRAIWSLLEVVRQSLYNKQHNHFSHHAQLSLTFACEAAAGNSSVHEMALSDFADVIDQGRGSHEMSSRPLWKDKTPDSVSLAWGSLRGALLAADERLGIWVDWYEAVRDGREWQMIWNVNAKQIFTATPQTPSSQSAE